MRLADLKAMSAAAVRFEATQEKPISLLVDFAGVTSIEIGNDELRGLAQTPQSSGIKNRVYVMPDKTQYGLGRLFSTHQRHAGSSIPMVLRSMAEAEEALGLVAPRYTQLPDDDAAPG